MDASATAMLKAATSHEREGRMHMLCCFARATSNVSFGTSNSDADKAVI